MTIRLDSSLEWSSAIYRWKLGHPEHVERLLRGEGPIPAHARNWLARLALGQERKWRGLTQKAREPKPGDTQRVFQEHQALQLFDTFTTVYATLRALARKEGRDSRGMHGAEEAARRALLASGLPAGKDALREIRRIRASWNQPAVIDLNYNRPG